MNNLDAPKTDESDLPFELEGLRSFFRFAPILIAVLALSACSKKPDPDLANCQIETAKLEGIIAGIGIEHEAGDVEDLQACLVSKARVKGIILGAASVRVKAKPKPLLESAVEKMIEDAKEDVDIDIEKESRDRAKEAREARGAWPIPKADTTVSRPTPSSLGEQLWRSRRRDVGKGKLPNGPKPQTKRKRRGRGPVY